RARLLPRAHLSSLLPFLSLHGPPPDLHSFPTRRSSDLSREAFILHGYPYRETSLLLETFTRAFGRVSMVARGARSPRSPLRGLRDRKSTRLNSSHEWISYAVFCLKKKITTNRTTRVTTS